MKRTNKKQTCHKQYHKHNTLSQQDYHNYAIRLIINFQVINVNEIIGFAITEIVI